MARRSFSFSFAEFVFLILLFLSGLALAFSGGGFVVNFQRVGFSVVTSLQKAVYSVCDGVTGVFTAVAELKSLKAENQELKEKLKNKTSMFMGQTGVGKSSFINMSCFLSQEKRDIIINIIMIFFIQSLLVYHECSNPKIHFLKLISFHF